MKVMYDARWLPVADKFDGVGRYTYELAHALAKRPDMAITWLISDERQIDKLPSNDYLQINSPDSVFREFTLPSMLNKHNPDVVYSPFYLMGLGLTPREYKLVLTIHDMIYFKYRTPPQWLPWYQRAAWWLFNSAKWPTRILLRPADVVATVSETTADEIHNERMTKRPIVPVINAHPFKLAAKKSEIDHSASNDIVYMGGFTPYKNIELLIDSMAALPDCTLHLLSRIPTNRRKELEEHARKRAVQSHVVFHDGITDKQYTQALKKARCLVTASKVEGFGLPILEAQAAGVPVACSDTPIFHEVAGEGAVFFDPDSPSSCAEALRSLGDSKQNSKYIQKGYKNLSRFGWDKSAEVAEGIIKDLA